MADSYESQFQLLLEEIRPISPQTADKLLQIESVFGARAAFYAAFVIVCLEARGKQSNYHTILRLTTGELSNFTFFEYTQENPQAIEEFSQALACYQDDCRRLSLDTNASAAG